MNQDKKSTKPHHKQKKYYDTKKNTQPKQHQHTEPVPVVEHKIIGQCFICKTGVSNSSYSLEYDSHVIHFECCLKKAKEIAFKDLAFSKKYKVMYLGSSTFAVYSEKGGVFQWNILQKMTLKEMLNPQKEV